MLSILEECSAFWGGGLSIRRRLWEFEGALGFSQRDGPMSRPQFRTERRYCQVNTPIKVYGDSALVTPTPKTKTPELRSI